MATYPLSAHSLPALRPWRGVARFFAWLTVFAAVALIALYLVVSGLMALPHGTGLAHALSYEPFHLARRLITRLSVMRFNSVWLLYAPSAVAALSALFSLGGPSWRRIMLSMLGALIAAFNLFACLALIVGFSWNEAASGVISYANYVALSASLIALVMASGCLILALASAMRWPLLHAHGARVTAMCWVALVGGGAGLLNASYFLVWGSWRPAIPSASIGRFTPIGLYFSTPPADRLQTLLLLFAPPVIAALAAFLGLSGPRALRLALIVVGLLAGLTGMVVCLYLLAQLFLQASGYAVLAKGGAIGLGASILIVVATFGLLSIPDPARRRAPTTRLLAESWPAEAA
jgi:hypothetical protein